MDGWEELNSQPHEVNRCQICGVTDCCPGHTEHEYEEREMDHEHEYLSDCCGALESRTLAGFCRQCRNHSVFTCDCGESQLSRHDTARHKP